MTQKNIPTEPQFLKDEYGRTLRPEEYPEYNPRGSVYWGIFGIIGITVISAILSVREDSAGLRPWNFSVFFHKHILYNDVLWCSLITAGIIVFIVHRKITHQFKLVRQQIQKESKEEFAEHFDEE